MINSGYNSSFCEEDIFSDEECDTIATAQGLGKRKLTTEAEEDISTQALAKLQSLDIEDDDDILRLDVGEDEEDALLLDAEEGDTTRPTTTVSLPRPKALVRKVLSNTSSAVPTNIKTESSNNDEGGECQMKWLRIVGLNQNGTLQCTVSTTALDTTSESGKSGKTESVVADTIRGMVDVYRKRRASIIDNGIVATPLHVVKKLAKDHEETLHFEVLQFPNGLHRLELFSGSVRGIGEGETKRIAAQMAAIDLLEKVQLSGGTIKVPPFGILPGWLTSSRVFGDLMALCESKGMPRPRITCKFNVNENIAVTPETPPFHAVCRVGPDLVTFGESETEVFAKREAAKEMYNLISGSEYKDTAYAIGKSCRRANELAAAGYPQVMSDYKKKWLLLNRVSNRQLNIPEDEAGLENPCDVEELSKDIDNLDTLGYELMKKKTLKVTVKNKKMKMIEDAVLPGSSEVDAESRCVSVENLDNNPNSWYTDM